tara:strand:- start:2943 stop:4643 length:1701 start_codon:yes stop_codon:yes gene_type:complete
MSLEEVFELYSRETVQEALLNNVINASTKDNPEGLPLNVSYKTVFQDLLWNPILHRYKFSGDDWDKMLALPSHRHAQFNVPVLNRMSTDCEEISAISQRESSTAALDIAGILDAQRILATESLDQHYLDFIATLSPEGKAQLEAEFQRVILDGGVSLSWVTRDNVGLAGEVPEYVETTAVINCNYILDKMESGFWSSYQGFLVDEAPGEQIPASREDIYATIPQNPLFTGNKLHVPLVRNESDGEVYQRVELEPISDELFELKSVRRSHHLLHVNSVGFSGFAVDQNSAMQMFVTVRGYFSSGCGSLGASVTHYDESAQTIYVDLYNGTSELPPGEGACTGNIIDYLIYQPLPVYGLPAGEYRVVVNGNYTLPLTLNDDNVHQELAGSTVVEPKNYSATLNGSTLVLPFVDMPDQAGRYQNIELREVAENRWQIADLRQANMLERIDTVELLEFGDDVKQVFLNVKGSYSHGCNGPGNLVSRFDNVTNTLEVNFYEYLPDETEASEGICATGDENFDFVYPLPVYAAPAGEYNVLVNGEYALTFSLDRQNVSSFIWRPFGSVPPLH